MKRELHTSNWGSLHPKLIHSHGCVYIYWGNLRRVIRVPSTLDPSILHGWVFIIEKRGHLHLWNECQVLIHFLVLYPNWDTTPFAFWLGIFNNLCHYGLCSCLLYYYIQACINDLFFILCLMMMAKKPKQTNKQTNSAHFGFYHSTYFLILYYFFNGYVHFQSWISSSKLKSSSSWGSWPPCNRLWLILFLLIFNARWYNSLVR
jgi:hypothetical protein